MRSCYHSLAGLTLLVTLALSLVAQSSNQKLVYLSYDEAQPVLTALHEILPTELKDKNSNELARVWPSWITRRDAEIRARLALGDEDSLVNLLLFGTSYTKQPRVTPKEIAQLAQPGNHPSPSAQAATSPIPKILQLRVDDLIQGLVAPRNNERLLFARRFLIE